jgi:hypothetical protein
MLARTRLLLLPLIVTVAHAQPPCSCGVNPPGSPPKRVVEPYGNVPEDLRPFSRFTRPHFEHYTKEVEYNGAARDVATVPASAVSEVAIGFLGPVENHSDQALGLAMLHGSQMAIDEANARGGYCGKPFALKVHNDGMLWGSSSNEIVKMVYDDKVWAMLGSISGDSTHIGLRVSLRAELPMVNSASTDPTIPETAIPWLLTSIQDDRVQSYTLARRIYSDLGLARIALLRVNDRYGRFGVIKFRDASHRLGHPVVIEQKFLPGDVDFRNDPETDARDENAPASLRLVSGARPGSAPHRGGCRRGPGGGLSVRSGSRPPGLARVPETLSGEIQGRSRFVLRARL